MKLSEFLLFLDLNIHKMLLIYNLIQTKNVFEVSLGVNFVLFINSSFLEKLSSFANVHLQQ